MAALVGSARWAEPTLARNVHDVDDVHDADRDTDVLVRRWQGGDSSAFCALYERYFDGVYGYARLMLRDRHQAEDAAQDVFAKVLRSLENYEVRPGMPFRAWLFRIARNTVIDHLRFADRVHLHEPAAIDMLQEHKGLSMPMSIAWANASELTVLMGRLPATQRDVIFMRYVLDMGFEQIAGVMDRTPKAVRHLHARALMSLERWLDAMGRRRLGRQGVPMLLRMRPAPVMAARRFALAYQRAGAGRTNRWGF